MSPCSRASNSTGTPRHSEAATTLTNWVALFLTGAGVVDLHRFHFLATTVFVPLEGVMIVVGDLDDFANLLLHAGNSFDLAGVGEGFGRGIVSAFREHDARAQVSDRASNDY